MRAIELFAGAGGAALGLEAAGIEHAALCEWDASACATLRAAGLGPVVEGDVRDLDPIAAVAGESCDLLWSSFPCQAWSTAGARKGAADKRNGWPWTVDAIDRFRPRWLLAENVRGLTFHSKSGCGDPMTCPGCYLERVILPDLRQRFAHAGYWVLDAADYGVPQHRRRVILWAGPVKLTEPPATHRDPKAHADLFDHREPWVSMGEALGLTAGSAFHRSHGSTGLRPISVESPSPTVVAGSHADNGFRIIGGGCNAGPWVYGEGTTGRGRPHHMGEPGPPIKAKGTAYLLDNGLRNQRATPVDQPAPTIRDGNGSGPTLLERPSPTVVATESAGRSCLNSKTGRVMRASDALCNATGRRRLTIPECARLQDFPADHPWQGTKKAQYRQVSNAVPPTLARVVGEAVLRADKECER